MLDKTRFEHEGRLWLRGAIDPGELSVLDAAFALSGRPGARIGMTAALQDVLGPGSAICQRLDSLLPAACPVRALAFDKTPDQNWGVPWHQDRVIAVQARHDVAGYGNWSQKAGVWHCEPPPAIWDDMLFLRLHLDPADAANGAMEIALGSHRHAPVAAAEAAQIAQDCLTETCEAARGDILVLKMLTLHRSSPATDPRPRRTFRVDFAAVTSPVPLDWCE